MMQTFFNLFDVVLETIVSAPKEVVLEIQLQFALAKCYRMLLTTQPLRSL